MPSYPVCISNNASTLYTSIFTGNWRCCSFLSSTTESYKAFSKLPAYAQRACVVCYSSKSNDHSTKWCASSRGSMVLQLVKGIQPIEWAGTKLMPLNAEAPTFTNSCNNPSTKWYELYFIQNIIGIKSVSTYEAKEFASLSAFWYAQEPVYCGAVGWVGQAIRRVREATKSCRAFSRTIDAR